MTVAPRLEAGTVMVDGVGTTVSLVNRYISPVVVTSVNYVNNTDPGRHAGPRSGGEQL